MAESGEGATEGAGTPLGSGDGSVGRLLVVMCDGTGNAVEGNLSNVMKLYRACVRDDRQRVFYDPGIGTIATDSAWGRLRQRASAVFGLATGFGLDGNVLDGYRFLCRTYVPGDRIMLFGFSRGAYTVRAIAGLLHSVGLLEADQEALAGEALNAYKHSGERGDMRVGWNFGHVLQTRRAEVELLGLWDTVASVIVPRPDRLYVPSLQRLPFTRVNRSVRRVRHAVAIDERRRMFRLNRWIQDQDFGGPGTGREAEPQDVVQMLFAGVHADIGGGYSETESGLAKFPLLWMADEAEAAGLRLDRHALLRMAGLEPSRSKQVTYVPPSATDRMHRSLSGAWWIPEWLPRAAKWRETRTGALFGLYLPRGERRPVPPGAIVHPSVLERMRADPSYRPVRVAPPQEQVDATS